MPRFTPNDPRINRNGRPPGPAKPAQVTARALARIQREGSIQTLVTLRDSATVDDKVRKDCALALLAYSDGEPVAMKPEVETEEPQAGAVPVADLSEAELTAQLSAAPTEGEA